MPTLSKSKKTPKKSKEKPSMAYDRFSHLGFIERAKPDFPLPALPRAISLITPNKLGDTMSQYGAWREYTEDLLNHSMYTFNKKREELDIARKRKFLLVNGKNKDERTAKIDTDPEIQALATDVLEYEMFYEMLSTKLTSIEKSIALISREYSRRSQIRD